MDSDFHVRNWTLELEADKPALLPVPNGCPCIIQGIYATDTNEKKIILEAKIRVIYIDRIDDETDIAPSEVFSPVLATVFPSINPSLQVNIQFSALNEVSVCATGGNLVLTGIYNSQTYIPDL